ncbi:PASTA domain-containing protein [Amycolatopsis balhimycina DSM 5908]|uniref:PASTA domain-containing protein n=1 Tax=Amycolatopsis balhimycina DSM 5908 TaxID=1081091 RepID=A0A428WWE7_AMYBA|nr:PKD domain-containing protein [Amycolatopsis balhimycina]RSM47408.1 PASTA domain-containing protein [Amycolatopsis balhimycina DSM 5908]
MRGRLARASVFLGAAVVAVGGLVVAGTGHGYPAQDVRMRSGSAWLASSGVGQVSLLDGTSAEVAAQVQVGPPGHALDVVQRDSTAYAVDRSAGTVRRVDGATFEPAAPVTPIDQARDGLTAFAGTDTLYTLDTQRGLLAGRDPLTLAPRGAPLSLAARLTAGTAALDDADRLWTVDDATGDLTWIAGGTRTTHRGLVPPGRNVLAAAGGLLVVVSPGARTATSVSPVTGEVAATIPLDLRPDDTVQVSGSPHHDRVYVVVSRGLLDICDLGAATCDTVVPLDAADRRLGAAVEAGDRLFVPDYSTGQVTIVDLTHPSVLARSKVLTPPAPFQLFNRDGIVFFNDPASERAGVIRLDGGVRPIAKYDPADPHKGLHDDHPVPSVPPTPSGQQPPPDQTPPGTTPTSVPAPPTGVPGTPTGPDPVPPATGVPTTGVPPTGPPAVAPDLRVTLSKTTPQPGEDISLRVDNAAGGAPVTARWDFGDGSQADGVTVTHHWTTEKTYQVSVRATVDGQEAATSASVQVTPPPSVTVPDVVGMPEAGARGALTAANLVPVVTRSASNTVPAGVVLAQTPKGGTSAAPRTQVTITVSSGKPAPVDLMARAAGASWTTGAGTLPFNGNDGDARGFALTRHGRTEGGCALEDGTAPDPYLETHPQWVDNGFINGVYTLPRPIAAGDHFRSKIGFVWCNPNEAGDATFVVSVIGPGGAATDVARVRDTSADRVMRQIDADLSAHAGATQIRLRIEAGASAGQDWASWIGPRIGA